MNVEYIPILAGALSLGFAAYLFKKIKSIRVENDKAREISEIIHEGAMTFLKQEYRVLGIFVVVITVLIGITQTLGWGVAVSFVLGAFLSVLAGNIGMRIATLANARTAESCKKSLSEGLRVAFSSGSVMGLSVVGLGIIGVTGLYLYFRDPEVIYGFGFGASLVALFARVGGGIYTKAADVGADLVGKVEAGIPEDDPRNPASIADNVGDNVGDVAGMGADLFESYVDSIIAAMALGAVATGYAVQQGNLILLPLFIASAGIVSAIIGNFIIKAKSTGQPHKVLNVGIFGSAIITALAAYPIVKYTVGDMSLYWAILTGLIAGVLIGLSTEYFTSDKNRPTQEVAEASKTGPGTNIISGFSLGLISTVPPVIIICVALFMGYYFAGFFGIAIGAVGMLATLGITLATDAYGPVADNAAGVAEMAGLGDETRKRAEELDAVGNTTAAIGKGFAIGSAALTALILLIGFSQAVGIESVNLLEVKVVIGLFLGGLLPCVFSALANKAVGQAAAQMVAEVRRQFKEIPGIMDGSGKPDYKACVSISTKASLQKMILPGVLAVASPVLVGLFLGAESLLGLLAGSTVVGFLLAVIMSNAGGAWDNAKKYIEAGNLGGKGSETHKAAVVGDTVGDPFKDTAGPSLNILIKLMAIVSIVIAPLVSSVGL